MFIIANSNSAFLPFVAGSAAKTAVLQKRENGQNLGDETVQMAIPMHSVL